MTEPEAARKAREIKQYFDENSDQMPGQNQMCIMALLARLDTLLSAIKNAERLEPWHDDATFSTEMVMRHKGRYIDVVKLLKEVEGG